MGRLDDVYARLPVFLQHVAVSAFGLAWHRKRFGGIFGRERDGFIARERFTAGEWKSWQTARLRDMLLLAVERVPYYCNAYRAAGLTPASVSRFEISDLRSLPLLEKEIVRERPEDFCVDGRPPKGGTVCLTSGSSGTPVRTWWTREDFQRSLALRETRACRPAGVSYSMPRATFSGRLVEPDPESTGPFHRYNAVERQVYLSAFHLSPAHAAKYVEPLVHHGVAWGSGYTHAFEQLALMMREQGIAPPPSMKAVITTSEPLTAKGRKRIETGFGCRVYQEYGQVEDAIFACEHADGRMRVSPDSGILELLDGKGNSVGPGEPGDVVATSFVRWSQLFIRYRLGDVASWDAVPDATGFSMPILKEIVGRLEDIVEGPDGRRTARFHGIFTGLDGVREAQIVQESLNLVRVVVVAGKGFDEGTEDSIRSRIRVRLGPVDIVIEKVNGIPKERNGKFRAVVSKVHSK
jgi:phenylacetate-CoA ligase